MLAFLLGAVAGAVAATYWRADVSRFGMERVADLRSQAADKLEAAEHAIVQALGRLRAEDATRAIPVMAMTASVMTNDRQKVLDAGFDAFQSKPIKIKDFVAAVEQLLERHRG